MAENTNGFWSKFEEFNNDVLKPTLEVGSGIYGLYNTYKGASQQNKGYSNTRQSILEGGRLQRWEMERQAQEREANAKKARLMARMRADNINRRGNEMAEKTLNDYASRGVVSGVGTSAIVPGHIVNLAGQDAYTQLLNGDDIASHLEQQAAKDREYGTLLENASKVSAEGVQEQQKQQQRQNNSSKASQWLNVGSSVLSVASKFF